MKRDTGSVTDPGGPGVAPTTTRRDQANPTRLGPDPRAPRQPFIDPAVASPIALQYAKGAEGRRRSQPQPLPRYNDPVAGGPDVPIPHLASDATDGTMADQARRQRGMPQPSIIPNLDSVLSSLGNEPALNHGSPGIVAGDTHQQAPTPARGAPPQLPANLRRDDMLPEQATQDPDFRTGPGSMFAANQPAMALKYGVVRNKQFISPAQLRGAPAPGTGGLRPETVDGLKALEEFQQARQRSESGEASQDQQEVKDSMAGPAGGAGSTEKPLSEEAKKELLDDMDEFQLSRLKNALFKDMLNNEEQKAIIEARLKPLDLSELIITGRVSQIVPIHPGVFEAEFQSYAAEEDLVVKRMIGEEAVSLRPSDRYLMDKYHLMGLTIAVTAINRRPLPDYRDAKGDFSEERFWAKYAIVARFNYHMMASLMVNWFWFDIRVRKLFRAESLGNG
jgi:hypothetical protein